MHLCELNISIITFWWVCCVCTHQKVMRRCSTHKGAFIINDFSRNPHFRRMVPFPPISYCPSTSDIKVRFRSYFQENYSPSNICINTKTSGTVQIIDLVYINAIYISVIDNHVQCSCSTQNDLYIEYWYLVNLGPMKMIFTIQRVNCQYFPQLVDVQDQSTIQIYYV